MHLLKPPVSMRSCTIYLQVVIDDQTSFLFALSPLLATTLQVIQVKHFITLGIANFNSLATTIQQNRICTTESYA